MTRIVILDADPAFGSSAHHEGQALSTEAFARWGKIASYETTPPDQVVARLKGASVALTNKVVVGREHFEQLPELKLVSVLATGVNVVDLPGAREHGVTVCNVPGYSTASTAQHTFALLLELCQAVGMHAQGVKAGRWSKCRSFSYFEQELVELEGLTLGIVGYGSIGRKVASLGLAFGMRVLVHTRTPSEDAQVSFVDKATLLESSDVVSLHCPLTEQTRHFIDREALSLMRPTALLLNCSRGPVIDEPALAEALKAGRLGGAGLDVLSSEPPPPDHPLLTTPNTLITPHIAWATTAARQRLVQTSVENVRRFLEGTPQNVVSP